jgi:hypothetical protein
MKTQEDLIDNYIDWFYTDNTDLYDELRFLIDTLLESDKKDIIKEVLISTYQDEKND